MTGLLSRFRVQTQIALGFAMVLVLLAATAFIGMRGIEQTSAGLRDYDQTAQQSVRMVQILRHLTDLRGAVRAHVTRGDEDSKQEAFRIQSVLDAEFKVAIAAAGSPEERAEIGKMAELFGQYMGSFEAMVKARTAKTEAIAKKMGPMGDTMTKGLNAIVAATMKEGDFETAAIAGQMHEAMLLFRMLVERYIGAPTPELAREAQQSFIQIRRVAARLETKLVAPERQKMAEEVSLLVDDYNKLFRGVVETTQTLDNLLNKVTADIVRDMRERSEALSRNQNQRLERTRDETFADADSSEWLSIAAAAVAMLLGLLSAGLIGYGIATPVRRMTLAMDQLAAGELDVEVPARNRRDEIGKMAAAVQVFKENAQQMRRMEEEAEENKRTAATEKHAALARMADSFESSVGGVVEAVSSASTQMQSAAQGLSATAEEASCQTTAVAAASEQASVNVQTVASAAEQLNASITEIGRQVEHSAKIADQAVRQAERTNGQVRALSEAAQRIGDVVQLITSIASQTNLLALNATIDAARAGEAGRGFAVVASEVKNLASQTAKATEEIGGQIASIQTATQEAVDAIGGIGHTIGEINHIVTSIASAVEEQGAATQEIARNVQQAAAGTGEVSTHIVSVTEAASQTGTAAGQMLDSARSLSDQSRTLRNEVERFLGEVRSAA